MIGRENEERRIVKGKRGRGKGDREGRRRREYREGKEGREKGY